MSEVQPAIFISYAHEDAELARAFAHELEEAGALVWLDQGELLIGDSLIDRISEAIAEFDFVAALVSAASVESNWCRKEIALAMSKQLQRGARRVTVLPLRVGNVQMPPSLADVLWQQLTPEDLSGSAAKVVADAAAHLERTQCAQITPFVASHTAANAEPETRISVDDEPVRMLGIDSDNVGCPSLDGSRGSSLYRIPIVLNRVPPASWSAAFSAAWNQPPAWTSMHRPGIASVQGNRIVLDGSNMDELEKYHLRTLKLVLQQLNGAWAASVVKEQDRQAADLQAQAAHAKEVRDAAQRLIFDDDED